MLNRMTLILWDWPHVANAFSNYDFLWVAIYISFIRVRVVEIEEHHTVNESINFFSFTTVTYATSLQVNFYSFQKAVNRLCTAAKCDLLWVVKTLYFSSTSLNHWDVFLFEILVDIVLGAWMIWHCVEFLSGWNNCWVNCSHEHFPLYVSFHFFFSVRSTGTLVKKVERNGQLCFIESIRSFRIVHILVYFRDFLVISVASVHHDC